MYILCAAGKGCQDLPRAGASRAAGCLLASKQGGQSLEGHPTCNQIFPSVVCVQNEQGEESLAAQKVFRKG